RPCSIPRSIYRGPSSPFPRPRRCTCTGPLRGNDPRSMTKLPRRVPFAPNSRTRDGRMNTAPQPISLALHHYYARKEAFAAVGVTYDQRQRHLNTGLSPRNPDGSYFIFVTLDKAELDDAYDYDDEIFRASFKWVTRRDRDELDDDYVAIRRPEARVLL